MFYFTFYLLEQGCFYDVQAHSFGFICTVKPLYVDHIRDQERVVHLARWSTREVLLNFRHVSVPKFNVLQY